jgi:hypothetical protein
MATISVIKKNVQEMVGKKDDLSVGGLTAQIRSLQKNLPVLAG